VRWALWFIGLFGVAAALALFVSGNGATVTVYWPPHRIDLSLNMVVLVLVLTFGLLYFALRALAVLFSLPGQARQWRLRYQERAMHGALLDALTHYVAGRFIRARKAAVAVLAREAALTQSGDSGRDAERLRVLAHLLAAESSQALQDRTSRDQHFEQALLRSGRSQAAGTRDSVLLRAVRWALEDRDAGSASNWLAQLPSGVARRTVALRLRLKVARMAGQMEVALDTARLLIKHRAFSEDSAKGLLRSLAQDWLQSTYDQDQLKNAWEKLESSEQILPQVACVAAGKWLRLGGSAGIAFEWLLPVWQTMIEAPGALTQDQKIMLVRVMENGLSADDGSLEGVWLSRIEQAQLAQPGDAVLQYLAGMACLHLRLWGKAHQLLSLALPRLDDSGLKARSWRAIAEMAQRNGNTEQVTEAWRQAAQVSVRRDR
jgi:HemY protein